MDCPPTIHHLELFGVKNLLKIKSLYYFQFYQTILWKNAFSYTFVII